MAVSFEGNTHIAMKSPGYLRYKNLGHLSRKAISMEQSLSKRETIHITNNIDEWVGFPKIIGAQTVL